MRTQWAAIGGRVTAGLAVGMLVVMTACKPTNKFEPPPPPKVTVAPPSQQKIDRYVVATGNLAPVNQVDLVARISGFLQGIGYTDGDRVKKGANLFTIEPRPYLMKLQQAQASQASIAAQLKQAEEEYTRQSTLGKQDFASQSKVDEALAKRDATRADLQQAEANTEDAAIQYTYTQVNAPFDGAVTAHLVSVGEYVGGTTPTKLATIVQLDPIWVNFSISEQDVLRIRASLAKRGIKITKDTVIPVEIGLQTETGFSHAGRIDYIAPEINQQTGTLALRGVFDNKELRLLPGYFARVRVPVERDIEALLVPDIAIGTDQLGNYLLVVNDQGIVEQRRVKIGALDGGKRVIESGLKPGENVVIRGMQRAVPGQKVTVEPSQAASAG